jgi:hypothetical protein
MNGLPPHNRTERYKRILIPRINLTYSGTILPFNFQRSQFPIITAFAMRMALKCHMIYIDKSQLRIV